MPLAIGAGAIAAILAGAVLGIVLLGPRTDAVADESPGPSPSASAAPSASGDASANPSPSAIANPSASPTPATVAIIPNLGIAEVTTDGLNLRAAANESSESVAMLERERRLFIIGQPTDAGDLRWYRVAPFDDIEGCESGCGLLGFVATPTSGPEDAWIEEVDVGCPPSPMTAQQTAALTLLEALHCYGRNEIVVTGTVDLPMHGPISPFRYSPGWLTYEHLEYFQQPSGSPTGRIRTRGSRRRPAARSSASPGTSRTPPRPTVASRWIRNSLVARSPPTWWHRILPGSSSTAAPRSCGPATRSPTSWTSACAAATRPRNDDSGLCRAGPEGHLTP